jgi:hypothetical protein
LLKITFNTFVNPRFVTETPPHDVLDPFSAGPYLQGAFDVAGEAESVECRRESAQLGRQAFRHQARNELQGAAAQVEIDSKIEA